MKRNIFLIFLSVLFFSLFCGCGEKKKSTASKQERLTVPVSKLYPKIKEHQMNLNTLDIKVTT
jgi:hypothetical protein